MIFFLRYFGCATLRTKHGKRPIRGKSNEPATAHEFSRTAASKQRDHKLQRCLNVWEYLRETEMSRIVRHVCKVQKCKRDLSVKSCTCTLWAHIKVHEFFLIRRCIFICLVRLQLYHWDRIWKSIWLQYDSQSNFNGVWDQLVSFIDHTVQSKIWMPESTQFLEGKKSVVR